MKTLKNQKCHNSPILNLPIICSYNNKFWFANNLFHKSSMVQKHREIKTFPTKPLHRFSIKLERLRKHSQKPLCCLGTCNPVTSISSSKSGQCIYSTKIQVFPIFKNTKTIIQVKRKSP